MMCEKCKKNEAVFYYRENVNGDEKTYRLCRSCLEEMKRNGTLDITDANMPAFDDGFFGGGLKSADSLFGSFFGIGKSAMYNENHPHKCPTCCSSLYDISKNGKVGCTDCYNTFGRELSGIIERLHGHTSHTGKSPKKVGEMREVQNRIASLEAERAEAVKKENYERAAEIRDELKKLRGGL